MRIRSLEEIARDAAQEAVKTVLGAAADFVEAEHPRGVHGRFTTSWHITDNPKFAFDPSRVGQVNSTIGGDMGEPGIFVTKDPEFWVNRHNYVRPFIAEIEHPADGVGTGYYENQDSYLPATMYDQSKIRRVIPIDEYVRENYHTPGWIEQGLGDTPDKFLVHHPARPPGTTISIGGREVELHPNDLRAYDSYEIPEDYRYSGPDVRDMPPEEVQRHMDRAARYIEEGERRWEMLRKFDDNGNYAVDKNGKPVFEKMRWNYTATGEPN